MEGRTEIRDALAKVPGRLSLLRQQRAMTLAALSAATGISTSTLSRLETGQRRASLELLLPLALAFRVPLEDLVGAPETGDPRIRLKPRRVNGRTVVPLTKQPAGQQAWKIVIPRGFVTPEPKSHEGYEWLYVLSGRIRLILAERDFVMAAGEVAEFDTRTPHWFGSTGESDAEVLSLFGPQGQRAHTRTDHGSAHPVDR
jgi:transcriptional regulator with XRE-family HTH domain